MTRIPQSGLEICAIIVTIHPDNGLAARLESVGSQVGLAIIVDNGEDLENERPLRQAIGNMKNVIITHNMKNVGLAAALNVGVSLARKNSFRWLLTLDDDTVIQPNMVERLLANLKRMDEGKPIGIAGMSWTEMGASAAPQESIQGPSWIEKRGIITSGSLFSLNTYDTLGPFAEDYVIDGIDYEYCLRARKNGFRNIRFAEIGFEQRLGTLNIRYLGPFAIKTYNYNPLRYYYAFRNNLMNVRKYALREPVYAAAVCIYFIKTLLSVGMFEAKRKKKIRFMICGLWHGLIGKMGITGLSD